MEVLAPLGIFEIARTLVIFAFSLALPGWLFLRLDHRLGITGHEKAENSAPLFAGVLETFCASVFFSVVICALAFIALTFTVGLNFWTALLLVAAINASMGYFVWKERR